MRSRARSSRAGSGVSEKRRRGGAEVLSVVLVTLSLMSCQGLSVSLLPLRQTGDR